MRRGVGVSRTVKNRKQAEAFKEKGKELTEVKLGHMQEQLSVFKAQLEAFAMKHKKQINKDPAFRRQFQTMCTKIGVDPLASNKGFWAEVSLSNE
jgi:ESCRT-II complex subunit VPS22